MPEFIARRIKKAAGDDVNNINVAKGQKRYAAYFNIKNHPYESFREDTDAILRAEGYEDCILED